MIISVLPHPNLTFISFCHHLILQNVGVLWGRLANILKNTFLSLDIKSVLLLGAKDQNGFWSSNNDGPILVTNLHIIG